MAGSIVVESVMDARTIALSKSVWSIPAFPLGAQVTTTPTVIASPAANVARRNHVAILLWGLQARYDATAVETITSIAAMISAITSLLPGLPVADSGCAYHHRAPSHIISLLAKRPMDKNVPYWANKTTSAKNESTARLHIHNQRRRAGRK